MVKAQEKKKQTASAEMREELERELKHLRVLVRQSRGADIAAACGQLAGALLGGSPARAR